MRDSFAPNTAQGLLASTDGIAKSPLSLEASLQEHVMHHPIPELKDFSQDCETSLAALARTIRTAETTKQPDLQRTLHWLKQAKRTASDETRTEMQIVYTEAATIVRSIDIMKRLLAL